MKLFVMLGSINMFLSVAIGAFGAHGLAGKVSERMLENWQTGAHYHIVHAVALLFIGLLADRLGSSSLVLAGGWFIMIGIVLFSGSLYAMALTGVTKLGAITPLGGVSFLIGWIAVAFAAVKHL